MKPSKLYEALRALCALFGERVPLHIWGPYGIGAGLRVEISAEEQARGPGGHPHEDMDLNLMCSGSSLMAQ